MSVALWVVAVFSVKRNGLVIENLNWGSEGVLLEPGTCSSETLGKTFHAGILGYS